MAWYRWAPYVPVATRRAQARRKMESLRKKGMDIQPIEIEGRQIAKTFWGRAWCTHLESFSDYENRLPRGRTYVRNGSVCHLAIAKGKIDAKVSGSSLYSLRIRIATLPAKKWNHVKRRCAGQIGSLIELLQGRLSDSVMEVVTDRQDGLFPLPGEISFHCDCPDWAVMCKHVAAVMYGVGARLDKKPELLFTLRGVNHDELIETNAEEALSAATTGGRRSKRLAASDLSDVFGIDIDVGSSEESPRAATGKKRKAKAKKKMPAKRATKRKTAGSAEKKASKTKTGKTKTGKKKAGKKKAGAKKAGAKRNSVKRATKKTVRKKTVKKKVAPRKVVVKKKAVKKTAKIGTPTKASGNRATTKRRASKKRQGARSR